MSRKKLIVGVLAGTMILGSIGVNASSLFKRQETLPVKTVEAVATEGVDTYAEKALTISDLSQELRDKLIKVYGDEASEMLFLNVEEAEKVANGDADPTLRKTIALPSSMAIRIDMIDSENAIAFSDLNQELQDKLIEIYGDYAYDMTFPSEEYAETIADTDVSMPSTGIAVLATSIIEGENTIDPESILTFSDLTQDIQDKLVKRYGDMASEMLFLNEEEAEELANQDGKPTVMKATKTTQAKKAK